jgi:hypothetical protein
MKIRFRFDRHCEEQFLSRFAAKADEAISNRKPSLLTRSTINRYYEEVFFD